jgi:hypothetical protein
VIVATGRLTLEAEAEVGQHLAVGSQQGSFAGSSLRSETTSRASSCSC